MPGPALGLWQRLDEVRGRPLQLSLSNLLEQIPWLSRGPPRSPVGGIKVRAHLEIPNVSESPVPVLATAHKNIVIA
eukprot:scaffold456_cov390-Prasinococcus_capsulatus_cf.AAC.9